MKLQFRFRHLDFNFLLSVWFFGEMRRKIGGSKMEDEIQSAVDVNISFLADL